MANPQASETRDMPFPQYQRLPDELKLAIWKQAIPSPAVHHFKLKLPSVYDQVQVMAIEPISTPVLLNPTEKQDPSIWRYTWIFSAVDTISHELIDPESQLLIWQLKKQSVERSKKKLANKSSAAAAAAAAVVVAADEAGSSKAARYGCKAMIDGSRDLVRFKFVGSEWDPWSLSLSSNRLLFKGIKRVALDWKTSSGHNYTDWIIRPLECTCNANKPHEAQGHCHRSLAKFVTLFGDLEGFYFTLGIKGNEIDRKWLGEQEMQGQEQPQSLQSGTKRTRTGEAKRRAKPKAKPAVQLIKETMDFFREATETDKNLETFQDRLKTFYEVRREDTKRLVRHDQMWAVIDGLRKRWREGGIGLRHTPDMAERAGQTMFKVLVYADPHRKQQDIHT